MRPAIATAFVLACATGSPSGAVRTDSPPPIIVFFVDDLHMAFRDTGRIRDLFKTLSKALVHDADLFSMVSSGPSSIAIDVTSDRNRLDEAIRKISGAALKPSEVLSGPDPLQGTAEVRYRAHVAMAAAIEALRRVEAIQGRRKVCIFVSNGYDLDPQLEAELSELTREAKRANVKIYTLDPQGLAAGPATARDGRGIVSVQWKEHVRNTRNSLRTLAKNTGGKSVLDRKELAAALERINHEH